MIQHIDFSKHRLFGIDFDVVTMKDAVDWVYHSVAMGRRQSTRYVVTPNISLTNRHQHSADFRKFIHHAELTIVDGAPLVWASRLFGKQLPERVAGSDLVNQVFEAAIPEMPLRVFLFGAESGVADKAARIIESRWPAVKVVGVLSPEQGFEQDISKNRSMLQIISDAEPDVLIVGLGAPKQESWVYNHRSQIAAAVTLCVGGTIDFIAGEQIRSPKPVRVIGMEWAWRIATNPRRLLGRYVSDAVRLPRLLLDELAGRCPVWQSAPSASASGSGLPAGRLDPTLGSQS